MSQHLCTFRTFFFRLTILLMTVALLTQPTFAEDGDLEEDTTVTTPEDQIEQDLTLFWGKKREVKVVQRRSFTKDGKIDVTLSSGIVPNDDFLVYYLVGLQGAYNFAESFSVELSFYKAFDQESGLGEFLKNSDIGLKDAQIREFIQFFGNLSVLWSPIYGKISLLGQKLSHFGVYTGLGIGMMMTEGYDSPLNPVLQSKAKPQVNAIAGFRWHLTQQFSLKTEYRHYFFEKIAANELSTPIALNLGLTMTF